MKRNKSVVAATFLFVLSVFIPRFLLYDAADITAAQGECARAEANLLFDNALERILIQNVVVDSMEAGVAQLSVYTLAGLKYATAALVCGGAAKVNWRLFAGAK